LLTIVTILKVEKTKLKCPRPVGFVLVSITQVTGCFQAFPHSRLHGAPSAV